MTQAVGAKIDSILHFHPLANAFPLMNGGEFNELVADIKARGQIEPIITYDGLILDGRNRYRACLRNKIEPVLRAGDDWIDDPAAYVISANIRRRHLKAKDKREAIAQLIKAKPELSNATIATQIKADDKTVAKVRRGLEATSEIPRLPKTVGKDGKARPAKSMAKPKDAVEVPAGIAARPHHTVVNGQRLSRKECREIMRVEIEHVAVQLAERVPDIARELRDILWDDRNAEPLRDALARALGIEEGTGGARP
jgi:hypothetical protein